MSPDELNELRKENATLKEANRVLRAQIDRYRGIHGDLPRTTPRPWNVPPEKAKPAAPAKTAKVAKAAK